MFTSKASTKPTGTDAISARARKAARTAQSAADAAQAAAQQAQATAQVAALNATSAAQTAADEVRHRVHDARGWAAPRLESVADYTTKTVAPRVSDALRTAAHQVSPDDSRGRRDTRNMIAWSVLGIAILAGAGAAAAVIRSRYRAAMTADSDVLETSDTREPDGAASPADSANLDQNAGVTVNGQAPSSGW